MDVDEDEFEEEEAAEDISEGYTSPSTEPTWAKKLKAKMKALFCMQAKGQYQAHVNAKMDRRRDKVIMMQVGLEVQDGSEERITDEKKWTRQHCRWSESEEETGIPSTYRAAEESPEEYHDW